MRHFAGSSLHLTLATLGLICVMSAPTFGAVVGNNFNASARAGTTEDPARKRDSSEGNSSLAAEAIDPMNPGTNAKAAVFSEFSVHARALAVADEISKPGVLENVSYASGVWSDFIKYDDTKVSAVNPVSLKVEMLLTGSMSGRGFVEVNVNGHFYSIDTRTGITNTGLDVQYLPSGGLTRILFTGRTPIDPHVLTSFSFGLEVSARADTDAPNSVIDFSGNSLDLIALSIVNDQDELVSGAEIISESGFEYNVRNAVPEVQSLLLVGLSLTGIAWNWKRRRSLSRHKS